MKKLIITVKAIAVICLSIFCFQGQASELKKNEIYPGYIILKDGTRVEGKLKVGSITDREVKVHFFKNGSSGKKTYRPKDLLGYGFIKDEVDELGIHYSEEVVYETHKMDVPPKAFSSSTVFVEKEVSGDIDLYCYYIEARSNVKNPYKYTFFTKDEHGNLVHVNEKNFMPLARKMFGSYSALVQKLGSKDFRFRNIVRLVRDYNFWATNQHDSTEYRVAMKNQ